MTIVVDIVSLDRRIAHAEVDMVTLPGVEGQMGILHGHAPLLTLLDFGEIILHNGNDTQYFAVHGGIAEVRPDKVTILADVAEQAEEIDLARARAARDRAQKLLESNPPPAQRPVLEAAVRRSNLRLRVAQRRRSTALPHFEGESR
jgi:F-type H+-transporting ATPase subunit epsilon